MNGTYIPTLIFAAIFLLWPEETERVLTTISLKVQVYWINWRMKRMAKALHKQLKADMKKHHGTELPAFKWVDIWDRD